MKKETIVYIGIDCGVNTGFAVWQSSEKKFTTVKSVCIHSALFWVLDFHQLFKGNILVRVEDARQRKWFDKSGREVMQGAGSVKRDAKIWEDFLTHYRIPFEMVPPKNNITKVDAETFKKITGWEKRTNEHGRDAAMLVFGF